MIAESMHDHSRNPAIFTLLCLGQALKSEDGLGAVKLAKAKTGQID